VRKSHTGELNPALQQVNGRVQQNAGAAVVMPHSRRSLDAMIACRGAWGAVIMAGLAAAAVTDFRAQARAASATRCGAEIIAVGKSSRVVDGRSFVLEDGREVQLAAIEVPATLQPGASSTVAGVAARDRLAALLEGATVTLKRADTGTDRYGRVPAFAFVGGADSLRSLQVEMLAAGHARVGARVGSHDCAADLLAQEKAARTAKLGLWNDPYYVMKQAEHPSEVLAERGHFALVEGKVASVRPIGATIYVNFGRRWSEDFTVTILKRNERSFSTAGIDPNKLAGRRVRVRGWIEQRGGPWIEATRPEQIEVADGD
jgi:endonuclease YncB( thermonuclease family)